MLKGRLLASVCALGLLAAAPAFAAEPVTGAMGASSNTDNGSQNNATGTTGSTQNGSAGTG